MSKRLCEICILASILCVSVTLTSCGGMGAAQNRAENNAERFRVQVKKIGSGSISSSPAGIDCGNVCSALFPAGSTVALTATAPNGSIFSGWSGACSGTTSCSFSVNGDTAITASFTSAVSVRVSPANATLHEGQSQPFSAVVTGSTDTGVIWSVDGVNAGNATIGKIDVSGLYTAPMASGSHTVSATSVADTSKSGNAVITVTAPNSSGVLSVLTYKYDNTRGGLNSNETALTPSNVATRFGKLFSDSVDGLVFAQPLYMPNLAIPNKGTHNVIFVATEHDSVYALDADTSQPPLWHISFIDPADGVTTVPTTVANDPGGRTGLGPEVGITGTPVIDADTNTLFVSAMTYENQHAVHRLHALDVLTGAEKFGGAKIITATVPGTGIGNDGAGHIPFLPITQNQRAGLLLVNGVVYIPFASFSDKEPYHGWLFAYDGQTLQQLGVFMATPTGEGAGIWQGAAAPAADSSGNLFLATADGTFDIDTGGQNYGDTLLKLRFANGSFNVLDWFTPFNQNCLNIDDLDLGAGGPTLLPDGVSSRQLIVIPSKEGRAYVVDRNAMGHFRDDADTQIVDWVLINSLACSSGDLTADGPTTNRIYGSISYFNGSLYVGPANSPLLRYTIAGDGSITLASHTDSNFQARGATSVISADGTDNAILWVAEFATDTHQTILHAYPAADLSDQLFASSSSTDSIGRGVVFSVPLVANGKVYVGSEGHVTVFGLK